MVRHKVALGLLLTSLQPALFQPYQLIREYNSSNVFKEFRFFTDPDPTSGTVQYVPFETAASTGLTGNGSDLIYLGVDKSNVYMPVGPGRPSARLESWMAFTEGLFVIDLTHDCWLWSTAGLGDWPADGEIDIIENVNDACINNVALHTTGNYTVTETTNQTGLWGSTDYNIAHDENQGCAITITEPFNYDAEFNANGGGMYAMEWTSNVVRIWFFPPTGVSDGLRDDYDGIPDPETFSIPSASFAGPCSDPLG
ncbi:glycoside hydrolase family 16 protein [Lentithecium fluviatile CBS 122367]|uniref:Glycoside hydrolase family 16 protein n=1 Tax=Lentithecium fluviatile CBS 122367 TaxID=1168545 RepID=A0A6G1IW73_9PLEO|nr:glycoside hydrolase family 16 protein [Lentithecium fluviatile CBS 122367]